ncbi:phosphoglycerate dehydrogenase [Muricomes intestini]|jgi:D-3-phosphoglycerate dehydrogenase|uniref:D-3-phosphoglycerate dehydrogenase n=1 Tax=Muricomes intestini TaxID=1796634 RepID=A0A4R3KJF3_9FIRM|nr:phosphoglycerate dehydrogenase [Muricomes intestini]TCS82837.1 D-3-phosphoglycerate dehydrogenase [Muricomes intestini]HCR84229.1 3-phosphoglycerate dehydrogenase [Lachnospiraceae bacterium]
MYKYHCLNPIAPVGLEKFDEDFTGTEKVQDADAILVRSALMCDMEFDSKLKVIARAGAGVNNIPLERCAEEGIVVFNTPGANANGVKELVIAGMLLAARDIIGGINWVQEHEEDGDIARITEKKKKLFSGTELDGKKLGVIGLGAIGVLVANTATHLGMEVYGYDPYVSVDSAWKLSRSIQHAKTVDELYKECDYITIHVPATNDTKGMIDKDSISLMKKGVVILNFARDILVNGEDMVDALVSGAVKHYVTDFPTPEIAGVKGAIVIPHLGASTEESEDNCAKMAVKEIMDYLKNGNIVHSVNYPDCDMGEKGENPRITILHRNIPNMLGQFTALLAKANMNISLLTNKSRKEYAYTMIDTEGEVTEEVEKAISQIDGVLKVRVLL